MYQTIGEKIEVAGIFSFGKFQPTAFKWNNRKLKISEVTLVSDMRDGQTRHRLYSVMAENVLYRLDYNRENEVWMLEEIYVE